MFKYLACALALLLPSAAVAQKTPTAIQTEINTKIIANGAGAITATILNGILNDLALSYGGTLVANTWALQQTFSAVPNIAGYAVNVLALGANPNSIGTGSFDNSAIINNALATVTLGTSQLANVYLPAGSYHIRNPINLAPGQCLVGDGWQSRLDVDMDFSSSASGIVIVTPTNNASDVKPCIKNISIVEHLPSDIVTTANAATAGANSITVANAAGITNGMFVYDQTTNAAIPSAQAAPATTVTGVVGSVVSITPVLAANVLNGDTIHFAQPRSGFAALGSCNTAVAGGAPCQYPWAIYNNGAQNMDIDYVFLPNAYNGIYLRGATPHVGYVQVAAFNIGLDQDSSSNFGQIDDYEFWVFRENFTSANGNTILANVFYDGSTVAANLGRGDGIAIGKMQIWTGIVNLTSNFTWGSIGQLMMDGTSANLSINHCNWLQIGQLYSTKGQYSVGTPIAMNATGCRVQIDDFYLSNYASGYNGVTVANGYLKIIGGRVEWNVTANSPPDEFLLSGGAMDLSNVVLNASAIGTGATYVHNTGGSLKFQNNQFFGSPNGGGSTGLNTTDNALNLVSGNLWNGWAFAPPGSSGIYEGARNGAAPTNSGSCSINTQVGNSASGSWKANGACAAGTVILAMPTAPGAKNGWVCNTHDQNTPADLMNQTATTTTSVTFTGNMAANDVVTYACVPY